MKIERISFNELSKYNIWYSELWTNCKDVIDELENNGKEPFIEKLGYYYSKFRKK